MSIIVIYEGPRQCTKCLGWKRVSNTRGKPWVTPRKVGLPRSILGLARPVVCPQCNGTGEEPEEATQ